MLRRGNKMGGKLALSLRFGEEDRAFLTFKEDEMNH